MATIETVVERLSALEEQVSQLVALLSGGESDDDMTTAFVGLFDPPPGPNGWWTPKYLRASGSFSLPRWLFFKHNADDVYHGRRTIESFDDMTAIRYVERVTLPDRGDEPIGQRRYEMVNKELTAEDYQTLILGYIELNDVMYERKGQNNPGWGRWD